MIPVSTSRIEHVLCVSHGPHFGFELGTHDLIALGCLVIVKYLHPPSCLLIQSIQRALVVSQNTSHALPSLMKSRTAAVLESDNFFVLEGTSSV